MDKSLHDNLIMEQAGIVPGSATYEALGSRANILAMSEEMVDAALAPTDPGGLSHSLRAALACRIAALNGNERLAEKYRSRVQDPDLALVFSPDFGGGGDARLKAIIAFTDLVSTNPRDVDGPDIEALKEAGLNDADIVRLAELNAFMAYQIRLIVGFDLMRETE